MSIARFSTTISRRLVPFMLASRMIGLTSSTSLALVAQLQMQSVNEAHAAANQAHIVQPLPADEFLSATNAARAAAGIAPLRLDSELSRAALAKAIDMDRLGYWDHFRPIDEKAPWDFISESGYEYTVAGENLARGFRTVRGITNAWLNSPTHRANLLSDKYTDVGFADIEGKDANGEPILLTVQMFASR